MSPSQQQHIRAFLGDDVILALSEDLSCTHIPVKQLANLIRREQFCRLIQDHSVLEASSLLNIPRSTAYSWDKQRRRHAHDPVRTR